ncbi:MAG: O-acetyl-ADP-ribose deacetylase [Deltaproteobacteria bacterium]|nr:O-acetyl-ADP-ribose deacetylase [Deltaproteobacteria bacterium]
MGPGPGSSGEVDGEERGLVVVRGDITLEALDAIVNAANPSLLGGGGVDGAIHAAAGPGLVEECAGLGGCPPGQARMTKGYRLPARYVIHTAGPVWRGGTMGEDEVLASCYRESLRLAEEAGLASVAFPSISTGIYGFPIERASRIALREICAFLLTAKSVHLVKVVTFGPRDFDVYRAAATESLKWKIKT